MSGNKFYDSEPPLVLHDCDGLTWRHDLGMGYLQLQETPYDAAYFEKYVGYENTEIGKALNEARTELVKIFCPDGALVDVGIGSGQFMRAMGCFGFDVNPVALEMLHKDRLFLNPHDEDVDCATFWDSLEHIQDIAGLLEHVKQFAFVSIPIFRDIKHAMNSKHFRPDEHAWYFTNDGFIKFMYAHGFTVIGQSTFETDLGREDIGTYICKRAN